MTLKVRESNEYLQASRLTLVGLLVVTCASFTRNTSPPPSPCPGVLTYDYRDHAATSRWSANIEIRPEERLRGFTLIVGLDRPADILWNLVGDVTTPDNTIFTIKTHRNLPGGEPFTVKVFVKHSGDVPAVKTIHLNGVQICPTASPEFHIVPRRALAQPGDSVVLLGRAGTPLSRCHFVLPPDGHVVDLSRGRDSPPSSEYEYHGRGLDRGECGLRFTRVREDHDGVVECRVRPVEHGAEWASVATTLRVTNVPAQRLPVFEVIPRRKTLTAGDNLTVTCNADRPLNLCHFYLPGQWVMNLDLGPASEFTSEYRYHGDGLQYGHCGVTLTGVDHRLNGYLVCKLGRWPEQVHGAWETDAMKIETTEPMSRRLTLAPTTAVPPRTSPIEPVSRMLTPATTTTAVPPRIPKGSQVDCGRSVVAPPPGGEIHGQHTYHGEWPWHIALYQSSRNGNLVYICGGSLIGARSVLTAAHCVTKKPFDRAVDPGTLLVYLGRHHLHRLTETGLQEKSVERIIVHPTYNRTNFNSDLAVLILKHEVNMTDHVRPVCLWNPAKTDLNEVEGREGTVVGWGIDKQGQLSSALMKAPMPVVSYVTCVMSKPLHFLELLRNTTYCAGFRNGTTVCNGDSGGGMVFPIMTSRGRRWFLRGLVSNSVARTLEDLPTLVCDPRHYVVFTDVAQFLAWLAPYVV